MIKHLASKKKLWTISCCKGSQTLVFIRSETQFSIDVIYDWYFFDRQESKEYKLSGCDQLILLTEMIVNQM